MQDGEPKNDNKPIENIVVFNPDQLLKFECLKIAGLSKHEMDPMSTIARADAYLRYMKGEIIIQNEYLENELDINLN